MGSKGEYVKSSLELLIANIDEFDYEYITYKAESMKELLQATLNYIKELEENNDYNIR